MQFRFLRYTSARNLTMHCLHITFRWAVVFLSPLLAAAYFGQSPSPVSDEQRALDVYRSGNCATAVDLLDNETGRNSLLAGQCYLTMRNSKKAQAILEKYHAAMPEDIRGILLLARADCAVGNCHGAISLVKGGLEKDPDNVLLTHALASAYAQAGQNQDASDLWQKLLSSNPSDPASLTGLANLALASSKTKHATELLQQAISAAPDHAPAHAALGRIALQEGDTAKAIAELQRAYDWDPANCALAKELVSAYVQSQHWDSALSIIEGVPFGLAADDEFAALYSAAERHLDNRARAVTYYQSVIRQNPNSVLAHLLLADILYDGGKYDEAKNIYEQGIAASASASSLDLSLRLHLGRAQFRTDNMAAARTVLGQVLAKEHANKDAMFLMAQIAASQQQWDEARTYSNMLLLDDPKNIVLLHIMADAALSQNLDAEAARYLEQLFQVDSKDDGVRMKLVVLYSNHKNLGQLPRAFSLLNDAIAAHPEDPEVMLLLANLYRKDEQLDKANELFMKGFEKLPPNVPPAYSWAFNSYGLLLFTEKKYADALPYQERAVQLNPKDEEANYNLALTYLKTGKKDEVLKTLDTLRDLQSALASNLEQLMDRAGIKYKKATEDTSN
jgi:tetratricopeptide (TPR) repeat protein